MTGPRKTARALATAMAGLLLAAGCTPDPTDKDAALPTRTLVEAIQQAKPTRNSSPTAPTAATCSSGPSAPDSCAGRAGETADDNRWYLGASFNLNVPATEQPTTIDCVKTALQREGWQIAEENSFADSTPTNLTMREPSTNRTTNLYTTKSPTRLAISLDSPATCPPPGEPPQRPSPAPGNPMSSWRGLLTAVNNESVTPRSASAQRPHRGCS